MTKDNRSSLDKDHHRKKGGVITTFTEVRERLQRGSDRQREVTRGTLGGVLISETNRSEKEGINKSRKASRSRTKSGDMEKPVGGGEGGGHNRRGD